MPSHATRREFLKAGTAVGLGLAAGPGSDLWAAGASDEHSLILLLLVGGPSQLETFDPKPDAPAEVRGPFGSIATRVPGVRISEHLPRLAARMDRVTLVRSLHHDAAPIHETGHQLVQTGRLCRTGQDFPHVGSVASRLLGPRRNAPPFVVLPGPIEQTGVAISHGQSAGLLGTAFDPLQDDGWLRPDGPETVMEPYGRTPFGRCCLRARRWVEAGARVVVVNMYSTVFDTVSWDCHGSGTFSTLDDYRQRVLPEFDWGLSALLDDLERRGRLDSTLVVATGEFGRTPRLNAAGGRDHWPSVWSALVAGAGTEGGTVIGASGPHAGEPADQPVAPADLVATMYRALGIDPSRQITLENGTAIALSHGRSLNHVV
jgi:hypothetical protein